MSLREEQQKENFKGTISLRLIDATASIEEVEAVVINIQWGCCAGKLMLFQDTR